MIAGTQIFGYPIGILLILPIAVSFGFIPRAVKWNISMDQFLRKIYLTHPKLWRQLGRPRGRDWSPRYESVKMEEPDECPPDGTVQFGWFDKREPFWLREYPDLVADYRELRKFNRILPGLMLIGLFVLTVLIVAIFE